MAGERQWRILVSDSATKYLERLTDSERERVRKRLIELVAGPHGRAKRLGGRPQWSLHIGGLRALLDVDESAKTINVAAIGPRGDVYK